MTEVDIEVQEEKYQFKSVAEFYLLLVHLKCSGSLVVMRQNHNNKKHECAQKTSHLHQSSLWNKKANSVFRNKLQPKLLSRSNVEIIYTEFAGHCLDHVKHLDLNEPIHIVTVSGDGLLFEVINGLYQRSDWKEGIANVWIGLIPCGTGNALSCSLARKRNAPYFEDFGLKTALKDVLHRRTQDLDLIEIELEKEEMKVLSFIGVTIGLIADVDIATEWIRCMGYLRAYLMVACRIVSPKLYKAKLSYLPLERDPTTGKPISVPCNSVIQMPPLNSITLPDEWHTETESYIMIYADNLPLLDPKTLLAPESDLNDGIIWLVIVREGMNRKQMLDWLLHTQAGNHVGKPGVDIIPVRAFIIEPIMPEGYLSIDGEKFKFGKVQGQICSGKAKLLIDD
ncbi:LOW QUALITY PROTEIN: sphingosine kinase 1 [Lepeophtheirus salmonis]|uniref:LOW QUALITY PROTEIN: sphingosine kinase 1 n=1 Tax=Lepeophtheirus salmonis TaxID=72036 RepID=UPI003AF3ED6B